MASWYLLYCKHGQLLRAKEHLERQSVHCFSPMILIKKLVRGKRTQISEPLFPNYLFVQFDPEKIHTTTVSATRGVSHFVRFGAQPAAVPPTVITTLEAGQIQCLIDPELPCPGDSVLITKGVYKGFIAIFSEPDGETRSMLLLTLLHKRTLRSISNRKFQKL